MTLENIVKGLRTVDENPVANPEYDSGILVSTGKYLDDLGEINTRTKEGLASYRELTGLKTKSVSSEKIDLTHRQIHADVTEGFGEYITKHIEPITGELKDIVQLNIGYSFCPEAESGDKKYNTVRDVACKVKELIKTIEENPEAYISQQIKDAQDFMKAIVARFPDEVRQIDAQDAQRKALGAIQKYGSKDFVVKTHGHLETLKTAYITDMKALGEKEQKARENMPQYMDADESAKYFVEIEKAKGELEKRAEQLKILPQLTNTVVKEAINAIQERENTSKKASN